MPQARQRGLVKFWAQPSPAAGGHCFDAGQRRKAAPNDRGPMRTWSRPTFPHAGLWTLLARFLELNRGHYRFACFHHRLLSPGAAACCAVAFRPTRSSVKPAIWPTRRTACADAAARCHHHGCADADDGRHRGHRIIMRDQPTPSWWSLIWHPAMAAPPMEAMARGRYGSLSQARQGVMDRRQPRAMSCAKAPRCRFHP